MESAEIVGRQDGYWVILSESGRRYFLQNEHICGRHPPSIGQRGVLNYVQKPASKVLTFIEADGLP